MLIFVKESKQKVRFCMQCFSLLSKLKQLINNQMDCVNQKRGGSQERTTQKESIKIESVFAEIRKTLSSIDPQNQIFEHPVFDHIYKEMRHDSLKEDEAFQFLLHFEDYLSLYQGKKSHEEINETVKKIGEDLLRTTSDLHFNQLRSLQIAQILFSRQNSQKKTNLNNYKGDFQNFQEINQLAQFVKICCEHDLDAFYFLSDYLMVLVRSMSAKGFKIIEIQQKIANILEKLKVRHPPNDSLPQSDQLELIGSVKGQPNSTRSMLLSTIQPQKRSQQLQKFIIQIAKHAGENIKHLIDVTKSPAYNNEGQGYKTGVKIASEKSTNAIDRVKEKLLSKKFHKYQISPNDSDLDKFLQKEEKACHQQFDSIFNSMNQELKFNVSDMLRGKCMFSEIGKINDTAKIIIENCQKNGYKVVEIDNRLGKKTTDLVFKIEIQGVIAEFQLAYKFNVVKNEFNHKLYEIQRSNFFSVISTLYRFNMKAPEYFSELERALSNVKRQGKEIRVQLLSEKLESIGSIQSEFMAFLMSKKYIANSGQTESIAFKQQTSKVLSLLNHAKKADLRQYNPKQNRILRLYRTSIFLQNISKSKEAELKIKQCLKQVQSYGKKIDGTDYQMETLKRLGEILFDQGQVNERASVNERMLKTMEKSGQQSAQYGSALFNVGHSYQVRQKFDIALEYYEKGLKIYGKIYGKQSTDYAGALHMIGSVYLDTGREAKAIEYFGAQISIRQKSLGHQAWRYLQYAEALQGIGQAYLMAGQNQKALTTLERCLGLREKYAGKDSFQCTHALIHLGNYYISQNNLPKALECYTKCYAIEAKVKGPDSIYCADTSGNLADVQLRMGNPQNALLYHQRSIEIFDRINGKGSLDGAWAVKSTANIYEDLKDYPKALQYYRRAFQIYKRQQGQNSNQCKEIFSKIKAIEKKL